MFSSYNIHLSLVWRTWSLKNIWFWHSRWSQEIIKVSRLHHGYPYHISWQREILQSRNTAIPREMLLASLKGTILQEYIYTTCTTLGEDWEIYSTIPFIYTVYKVKSASQHLCMINYSTTYSGFWTLTGWWHVQLDINSFIWDSENLPSDISLYKYIKVRLIKLQISSIRSIFQP